MSNANRSLQFTIVKNGTHKRATTHFGVVYDVMKSAGGSTNWAVEVTVPSFNGGRGGGTETLLRGVNYNAAIKAANEDYVRSGGR